MSWRRRLLLVLLASLVSLPACGGGGEEGDPAGVDPPDGPDAPVEGEASGRPESDADRIERLGLSWVAGRPYAVRVRVAFVDFPSGSAETRSLLAGLASGLSSFWGNRVRFDVAAARPGLLEPVLEAGSYWDLSEELRAELTEGGPDRVALFRFARTRSGTVLSFREIDCVDGILSASGRSEPGTLVDLYHRAIRSFENLFSQEGYLLGEASAGEWEVLLRGAAIEEGAIGFSPGVVLQVHRRVFGARGVRYPRLTGSFVRLESIGFAGGRLRATARFLGGRKPAAGDKIVRVHLPGGERHIRLLDAGRRPLEGYSLFLAAEQYSTDGRYYAGISDADGQIEFADEPGRLRYLTVMRTVRGTPHVFTRQLVHTGAGLPAVDVLLPGVDRRVVEEAGEVDRRRVSREELEEFKRRANMYLTEAELYIRQGQYRQAKEALRKGIALLESLDNPEVDELKATFERLARRFNDKVVREEEIEHLEKGRELIERADRAVLAWELEVAERLLAQASSNWPREHFAEAGSEIDQRLARVRQLLAERQTDIGRARRMLLVETPRLDPDVFDDDYRTEAMASVRTLSQDGLLDLQTRYSDLEFLQYTKRLLDELAQRVGNRSMRAKDEYEAEDDVLKRQRLYEIHARFLEMARQIDELLGVFPSSQGSDPGGESGR